MSSQPNKSDNTPPFEPQDQFLRRIPPWHLKEAGKVSSAAFDNDPDTPDRMSVNWLKLSSVAHTLSGFPHWGVASITAALCYSLKQQPIRSPAVDNVAHCDIVGQKNLRIRRALRNGAQYLRYPDNQLP